MNPALTVLIVTCVFLALFVLEQLFPLRNRTASLWHRLLINLAISALVFATAALLVKPLSNVGLRWASEKGFGLLHLVNLPAPLLGVLGFLLMDLSFYYWHRANHKIPWLWRFHNVHHIDADLDVSTAFRFHFGEVVFSAGFRLLQVVVLGISVWGFAIYELVFQANTLFHHSNWRLPLRLERVLNVVLVTPRMHGIHHSQTEQQTNSNYSTVFSWWDRLHRSFEGHVPQADIVIGVPAYTDQDGESLVRCLLLPFTKQRDYWRKPEAVRPNQDG